jgi:ethanolamine transporter EutH
MEQRVARVLSVNLILVAAAVFGSLLAGTAAAQTRPALVRDADQPARQSVTIRKFTSSSIFEAVYTVPAGKHFVLEHMNCTSLDDQLYAGIFNGSLTHANIVYSVPVINTSGTVLVASGDTRIYFAAGAILNLRIFANEPTTCTLSGHTVDI